MKKIVIIRNKEVILDRDLAILLDTETKYLNQSVKRNIDLFSCDNRFQLDKNEFENWKSQIVTSNQDKMGLRKVPFVFTKKGVEIVINIMKKDINIDSIFNEEMIELPLIYNSSDLSSKIHSIRGLQIMSDCDLAQLYQVETKVLNQAVKRNSNRFPSRFRFQLNEVEFNELISNCEHLRSQFVTSSSEHGGRRYSPFVFTEQGIAMLATVLNSEMAVNTSIKIMDAFIEMRKFITNNATVFQRIENLEQKQISTDIKLNQVFNALEENDVKPKQGLFYNGQMFDAYKLISDKIRSAKKSIILIDNYIDDSTLLLFTKRNKNVKTTFYTKNFKKALKLDLEKHNSQYEPVKIKKLETAHDRFLIIDNKTVYHFGASLKDLGLSWFAFSKLEIDANDILEKLK